eukprot:scaffold789_cov261-Pinguiococcus_pyrenoidosus.AAC.7
MQKHVSALGIKRKKEMVAGRQAKRRQGGMDVSTNTGRGREARPFQGGGRDGPMPSRPSSDALMAAEASSAMTGRALEPAKARQSLRHGQHLV